MRRLRPLTFLLMAMALHTQAQTVIWTTGTYSYDGAGNIRSIGSDGYTYDGAGRLKSATLVMPGGMTPTQTFTYDSLGNLTSIDTTPNLPTYLKTEPIPVNPATNRLTGRTYDAAGNVTVDGVEAYEWDATGSMIARRVTGEEDWLYLYTATDERIAVFRGELKAAGQSGFLTTPTKVSWTIRDLDAKPMAVWESSGGTYGLATITWKRDYVWGFGRLMATIDATGTRHVHTDHLGTPRLITSASGAIVEEHEYCPFGFEATTEGSEPLKFTSHERDLEPYSNNDLDYMHARYYSPVMGRFLSVDPVVPVQRAMRMPQAWNRYAYVANNPLRYWDPDGRIFYLAGEELRFDEDHKPIYTENQLKKTDERTRAGLEKWAATDKGAKLIDKFNTKEYKVNVTEKVIEGALGQAPKPSIATLIAANDKSKIKEYNVWLNPSAAVDAQNSAITKGPRTAMDMMAAAWAGEMLHIYFYSQGISLPHHSRTDFQNNWQTMTEELGFPGMLHGND